MAEKTVLVTGASGFLGSHFVLALSRSRPSRVVALVRGKDSTERRNKIEAALESAAASYSPVLSTANALSRISIVEGDIERPVAGVSAADASAMAAGGVDEMWHFAASLAFEEKRRDRIEAQNIGGAKNAVALAAAVGAARFIYVSTAYTSGLLSGDIPEDFHASGVPFGNAYEESKWHAENAVAEACKTAGIALTVLRPSVVIGCSETKRCAGTASGLYGFIREVSRLAPALRATSETVRVGGNPRSEVNFIPVDHVMVDIVSLIAADYAGGPVFHLTSSRNVSIETALRVICERLDVTNLCVSEDTPETFSPLERLLAKRTSFYRSYMLCHKRFKRAMHTRHEIDESAFIGYVVEGIRELKGESVDRVLLRGTTPASDGVVLSIYERGASGSPSVLVVNAVGMPVELVTPLMARLSETRRAITWESRGIPSWSDSFEAPDASVDLHVADLIAVADAANVRQFDVVGWCSGAAVALRAASLHPERIRTVTLLNGSFEFDNIAKTPFQSNMRTVMPLIAEGRKRAAFFHRALFLRASAPSASAVDTAQAQKQTNVILSATDPDLVHLTSIPFQSTESLYRYALLTEAFAGSPYVEWASTVHLPVLVATGNADRTAHPAASLELARLMPNATIRVSDGDHFELYKDERLGVAVSAFLSIPRADPAIEQRVAKVVAGFAMETDVTRVRPEHTLRGDFGIDSLSLMTLIVQVERACGVDFNDSRVDLATLATVGDLVSTATMLMQNTALSKMHSGDEQ